MCTVSLITRRNGYILGMNRDEKRARIPALPPKSVRFGDIQAVFPSEPSGGTWVGMNDRGLTLALINWYSVPTRAKGNVVSRGEIVRNLLCSQSIDVAAAALQSQTLSKVNPFRLIGVSLEKRIIEWRWDLRQLATFEHLWIARTWISSGFDEPGAQRARGNAFAEALTEPESKSVPWLRRLHASHHSGIGPYSTCMHRDDAETVSYTEITTDDLLMSLRYFPNPPCQGSSQMSERRVKMSSQRTTALPSQEPPRCKKHTRRTHGLTRQKPPQITARETIEVIRPRSSTNTIAAIARKVTNN